MMKYKFIIVSILIPCSSGYAQ